MTEVLLPLPARRPVAPRPLAEQPELLPLDAGEHYRFAFDMSACIGCHSCEVACGEQNGLPPGTVWRRVGEIEGGEHPSTRRFSLSMACNHCLDPACLTGCPTNAYEKLPNGVVAHHADECIGCQYCTWGCPYSVPVFQPDRRIVTKCDLCLPRLEAGQAPACVQACPTNAITVEKVDVAAWRSDHTAADAPQLPSADLTVSTTRIVLPPDLPLETCAASDWNVRPEHPHWPLVWLTVVSEVAAGTSLTAATSAARLVAAGLAAVALAGALLHLGRPAHAYKALRNVRRSWLSREVLLLSLYAGAAALAVARPGVGATAAALGVAGTCASAQLYIVPGRPAWCTPLTTVRFVATALATGPLLAGAPDVAAVGITIAAFATVARWLVSWRTGTFAGAGSLRLELGWFRRWTVLRFTLLVLALATAWSVPALAFLAAVAAELIGRWLFFVTVVPLNMPGAFWRGAAGSHR